MGVGDIMNTRAAQQQCNAFSVGPIRSVDDPQLRELVETLCFFQASLTIYLSGVVTGSCGDLLCLIYGGIGWMMSVLGLLIRPPAQGFVMH